MMIWMKIKKEIPSMDANLLLKILECDANTSNAMKYLELGVYPIRYELMKRKILYLQYILKQDISSMIFQVLNATSDNPIKNDFVQTCKTYLDELDIKLSFQEIETMEISGKIPDTSFYIYFFLIGVLHFKSSVSF